ncbi:YggS family pyridoxal phosphate enzyme [Litorimonas cladophorae]|uniref:Pyridoxal phosphate homeostasis protein n=1 Tax=Litorimonas cladophorae TaxID=1220491 RepID=A0A918KKF9_9PROT|nr:YggS family pyridoxal phosphate-dependent enzyme [Litorimonas cladophorae]GGX67407.1 YggS family pyridoxal phosphate enzyme [Litorimonas cladophorae]
MSDISQKHTEVLAKLTAASKRGKQSDVPTLVAVSKVQPDERIADMLATGQRVYGENRVQEAQTRWGETFADHRAELELRLIGPLQTNKAADAVALFDVIETVDREKLLKALVKAGEDHGKMPRLYVQVNTGEEDQKSGVLPADLPAFLKLMRETYNLEPEGLMCIPPMGEAASPHFWLLSNLADANGIKGLSMGMSGDYEIAAEMGATSVRVGSALFGARDYG